MMKRILTALIVLSCIACNQRNSEQTHPSHPTKTRLAPVIDNPVLLAQPADMRKAMVDAYRLKPDQRFLLAISDIHHIVTGQPKEKAEASFNGNVWNINYHGGLVGTLPEFPDFSDILSCLTSYSRQLSKQVPMSAANPAEKDSEIESGIQRFFSADEIDVLKRIDGLWSKNRSSYFLYSAARAAVRLNLQSTDQLGIADSVPAHALALLALAESLNSYDLKAEEALLSQAMGYTGFAARRTAEFAAEDPIKLFVAQTPGLERIARDRSAPALTRYLWLIQVSHQNDAMLWTRTKNSLFPDATKSLAVVSTGLEVEPPRQSEAQFLGDLIHILPESILQEITGQNSFGRRSLDTSTVKEFESKLQSVAGTGPFGEKDILQAFYRGDFYSGFYWAFHQFRGRDKIQEGPVGAEYDRWVDDMQQINQANPPFTIVISDILQFKVLGKRPVYEMVDRFFRMTSFDSPQIPYVARLLASRLDSRIQDRLDLGYVTRYSLEDSHLTSKLYGSLLSSVSYSDPVALARCAIFNGDLQKVRDILSSDPCNGECALLIFNEWGNDSSPDIAAIQAEYDLAIQRFPHDWDLAYEWIDFLRNHQLYAEAISAGEKWMHANNDPSDVGYFHSHVVRSRTYYMAGQYAPGLAALDSVKSMMAKDNFYRGVVSRESAILLAALGKKEEAEDLARQATRDLAGDRETLTQLAVVLWRNGKKEEAADVVSTLPMSTGQFFTEVAKPFYFAFKDHPVQDAIDAVAALRSKHVTPANLMACARWFDNKGRPDEAFQIQASLQPGATVDEDVAINSFQYLKKWKGEKEATAWLDKLLPREQRNPLSVKFLYSNEFALQWDFIGDPSSGPRPDFVWLMRATASALMGPDKDPHKQELLKYYSRAEGDSNYQIGRYLLGLIGEKEVFALATTPTMRCQISYFLGAANEGKGLYEDASDWYRVAVETGQRHTEGWHLSFRKLTEWTHGHGGLHNG